NPTINQSFEDTSCRKPYVEGIYESLFEIRAMITSLPLCSDPGVTNASTVSSIVNARTLIVWEIDEGITHTAPRNYFLNYGAVDYVVVTETEAYVVIKNAESVNLVLATQPHFIRGRRLFLSKPDEEATSLFGKGVASNGTKADHQLVVDGLPPLPRDNDIRSLFGRFGAITEVRMDENMHRAFVNFSTAEALQKAVAAAPPRLKRMNLRVSLAEDHEHSFDDQVKRNAVHFQDTDVSDTVNLNRVLVPSNDLTELEPKSERKKSFDGETKVNNSANQEGNSSSPSTLIDVSVQSNDCAEAESKSEPQKGQV
ncbi:DAZ-associated protein 1, partial [Taenia solium]